MAAAAARKKRAQSLPRRTPDFVRPYLTKSEVKMLLEHVEQPDQAQGGLLDPSLESALTELRRWVS